MPEKEHINIVFVGHVDHGKSTLVGELLASANPEIRKLVEKLEEEARAIGKATFGKAWLLDRMKEERERGVTIDVSHVKFETQKYYFTIIDAPGHRDFVKNMITGASQADAAVLVVDAKEGVQEQTKEHLFLVRTLGITQLIVAVNKMDLVNYDKKRFEEVKEEVSRYLKLLGYKLDQVPFIPVSALKGDNVASKSPNMPWWDGPTFMEALDMYIKPPEKPIDKPLRIPIQDVYSIKGVGTVAVGRVETGILRVGDRIVIEPAEKEGEVKSIEMHHEPLPEAKPGDNIGFNIRGVARDEIRRGDVAGHPDNPPTVAEEFVAQIAVLQHPTAIAAGYTPVVHCHTAQVACKFVELQKKLDPKTGQVIEENPSFIKTGDVAIVKLRPIKPLVIEKVSFIPQLARFAVRDMGMTIAAGVCIDVKPEERKWRK